MRGYIYDVRIKNDKTMKTLGTIYAVIITIIASAVYGVIFIPACIALFVFDIICGVIAVINPDNEAFALTLHAIKLYIRGIRNCYSEVKYDI